MVPGDTIREMLGRPVSSSTTMSYGREGRTAHHVTFERGVIREVAEAATRLEAALELIGSTEIPEDDDLREWAEQARGIARAATGADDGQPRPSPLREAFDRVMTAAVARWHDSPQESDPADLHEWLGLTWEEYSAWVEGRWP